MFVQTEGVLMSNAHAVEMTYQYLEVGDIHEIHLTGATRQTMIEFFQLISRLYSAPPVSGVIRILIVQDDLALPLNYFMSEMRAFISEQRKMPHPIPTRFGIVTERSSFLHFLSNLLKLMHHQDAVNFFDVYEYDEAVTWLRS